MTVRRFTATAHYVALRRRNAHYGRITAKTIHPGRITALECALRPHYGAGMCITAALRHRNVHYGCITVQQQSIQQQSTTINNTTTIHHGRITAALLWLNVTTDIYKGR